jgi:hypothetical protein
MAECLACVPPAHVPDAEIMDHLRLFHPGWNEATPGEDEELIVRDSDYPHGLRCGRCNRLMKDGDRYAEELTGMIGGLPMVELMCIPCEEEITNEH